MFAPSPVYDAARHDATTPSYPFGASARHETINCDGCGAKPITGVRYKCSQCPNFDLCERCIDRFESNQLQHGNDNPTYDSSNRAEKHLFIRIADPAISAAGRVDTCNRAQSMHSVGCTGCGKQQIIGFRYSCQVCPNVNLCEACEALGTKHDATHPRVKACQQPNNNGQGNGQSNAFQQAGQNRTGESPFANRVTGGLFGMAHATSGRDGAFSYNQSEPPMSPRARSAFMARDGPSGNSFAQYSPSPNMSMAFGMANGTSGRDGGFGNLGSQPQSGLYGLPPL